MITYKTGNLFSEDAEALVNTVNCAGVMGRGVALQFKRQFPENFKTYEKACKQKTIVPGKMFVYKTGNVINPKFIINFPTKRHWRGASRIEDIKAGLVDLVNVIQTYDIKSVALPPLGCGLGGLKWNDVQEQIEKTLNYKIKAKVTVFEPNGTPNPEEMPRNRQVPKITPGRAALVRLVHRYLSGLLDPFITLLEVQKLMYFLQESGEMLRLRYTKGTYGPYAKNLSHVLNAIEGHFLSGYADGGDKPDKQLELVAGAYEDISAYLVEHPQNNAYFKRVSDLVEGFESPFGLELLATVHWVVKKEHASTIKQVIDGVYSWNPRKNQFDQRQIKLAHSVLKNKDWLE